MRDRDLLLPVRQAVAIEVLGVVADAVAIGIGPGRAGEALLRLEGIGQAVVIAVRGRGECGRWAERELKGDREREHTRRDESNA
jgi:hypothetical protein